MISRPKVNFDKKKYSYFIIDYAINLGPIFLIISLVWDLISISIYIYIYIYVCKSLVIIDSGNGMLPDRRQTSIWYNVDLLPLLLFALAKKFQWNFNQNKYMLCPKCARFIVWNMSAIFYNVLNGFLRIRTNRHTPCPTLDQRPTRDGKKSAHSLIWSFSTHQTNFCKIHIDSSFIMHPYWTKLIFPVDIYNP